MIDSGPPTTRSNSNSNTVSAAGGTDSGSATADSNRNTTKRGLNGSRSSSISETPNGHPNQADNQDDLGSDISGDEGTPTIMKKRHISASSTSSMTNGNVYPQSFKATNGGGKPRRITKVDCDDDDEVSFR